MLQTINDLTTLLFNWNFAKRKIDFAFVLHPRYTADIYRKYKFLKILPDIFVEWILLIFWPTYGGGIYNVKNKNGDALKGALMICPLQSKQMLGKRELAKKRVTSAVRLAEKYGATVIGLGALTSSVTNGGEDIAGHFPNITITSGNSLTTFVTSDDIVKMVKSNNLKGKIAIIGATGSIGAGVARILAMELENELLIIGKTPHKIEALVADINTMHKKMTKGAVGSWSTDLYHEAETIIVTTSAHDAVLHNYLLGPGLRIIYDVTQPKNTPPDVQNREDILYVDGGLIKLPAEIKITLDIGLPKGVAYSCLSETIVLRAEGLSNKKSGSKLSTDFIKEIGRHAAERGLTSHLLYHGHNNELSI